MLVTIPGPSSVSAVFPPHRSPCSNDGCIKGKSVKKCCICSWSLDHNSIICLLPYYRKKGDIRISS